MDQICGMEASSPYNQQALGNRTEGDPKTEPTRRPGHSGVHPGDGLAPVSLNALPLQPFLLNSLHSHPTLQTRFSLRPLQTEMTRSLGNEA